MTPGTKLGPYEILAPIGAGGMGDVYRARDTRLGREVAIKFSKEQFSERFEREARAVAALNHPNICQLYDVGPNYLVMELIEGEPLKGPLPLKRALECAGQILDALDAAHRCGIVHRDLKPANILVSKQGMKVLDFGLAKQTRPLRETDVTQALTQDGQIVGTLQYMSPEQLQGKDVDSRADIFSFGCVLYEMLTGTRAFDGSNAASVIAAIMERPAPSIAEVAPPALDRVLKQCLEKDPENRWQTARDLKAALELAQIPAPGAALSRPASGRAWWIASMALALSIAAAAVWAWWRQPVRAVVPTLRASLVAPPDATFESPFVGYAVSPDGRFVVFAAQKKGSRDSILWLRPLDSLTATELPGTENGNGVFWSPDSKSIGFVADDKLKRKDVDGGSVQILCDAPDYEGGSWNAEGVILFGSTRSALWRVASTGGNPAQVTNTTDGGGRVFGNRYPYFLPDGRHFLYTKLERANLIGAAVFVGSLDHPDQSVRLVASDVKAEYAPPRSGLPGYLLWLRDNTLMAQPFDGQSKLLAADPLPVADEIFSGIVGGGRRASFSVSRNGVLVYRTGSVNGFRMSWRSREGKEEVVGVAIADPRDGDPALSPDGRRVALERQIEANFDVWTYELGRSVMTRLTFDPGINWIPIWSPDGREVIYGGTRRGTGGWWLWRRDASGAGQQEVLAGPIQAPVRPSSWSRDGRYLLYLEGDEIMVLPLTGNREDRKPAAYLHTPFRKSNPQFSPDGKWVAYVSNETGHDEVYVQAFPLSGGKWQVTNRGGTQPRWRGDANELFFLNAGKLLAVGLRTSPGGVEIDPPRELFELKVYPGPAYIYDVTPDGQRFLVTQPANATASYLPMNVVSDWQASLKK